LLARLYFNLIAYHYRRYFILFTYLVCNLLYTKGMIKSTCVFNFCAEPSSTSMCIFCLVECSSIVAGEMTSFLLHMVMGKYLIRNLTHIFKICCGKTSHKREKNVCGMQENFCANELQFLGLTCQPVGHHTLPVGCSQLRNTGIK